MAHDVYHELWGRGVIVQTRFGGFECRVRFAAGPERWVRTAELRNAAAGDPAVPREKLQLPAEDVRTTAFTALAAALSASSSGPGSPPAKGESAKPTRGRVGPTKVIGAGVRHVRHASHGEGRIVRRRFSPPECLVAFGNVGTRWVSTSELEEVPCYAATRIAQDTRALARRDLDDHVGPDMPEWRRAQFRARRILESLRMGTVPFDCAADFTFGREREAAVIDRWLQRAAGVMVVRGEYGVGKTHMIHYTYDRALSAGYAVALVQVNPSEAPFSKPKKVYHLLTRSLRYRRPNAATNRGFENLIRDVLAKHGLEDHKYFSQLRHDVEDAYLWDWISGAEDAAYPAGSAGRYYNWQPMKGMHAAATAANIYTYLLSGLSWSARNVLGLKGLLLLFDEAESVDWGCYAYQTSRAHGMVQALGRTASDDPALVAACGRDHGMTVCGWAEDIPFAYRQPANLKVLFAMTPSSTAAELARSLAAVTVDLEPIAKRSREAILLKVLDLYQAAYSFQLHADAARQRIGSRFDATIQTRYFVKACVEALDIARHMDGGTQRRLAES